MAEITTTQTMGNKTITTTINTAARGPQGLPGANGTDAEVTQANIEAAIADKPGFLNEIGAVSGDGTGITDVPDFRDALRLDGWADPRDYGTITLGTGITEGQRTANFNAIQAALDTRRNVVCGWIGTCQLNGPLTRACHGQVIRGANMWLTILQWTSTGNGIQFRRDPTTVIQGADYIFGGGARNMSLIGPGMGTSLGAALHGVDNNPAEPAYAGNNLGFQDLYIRGWQSGLYTEDIGAIHCWDITAAYNNTGIDLRAGSSNSHQLIGCVVVRGDTGIRMEGGGSVIQGGDYGNNSITDFDIQAAALCSIKGGRFEGSTRAVIVRATGACDLAGASILRSGATSPLYVESLGSLSLSKSGMAGQTAGTALVEKQSTTAVVEYFGMQSVNSNLSQAGFQVSDSAQKVSVGPFPQRYYNSMPSGSVPDTRGVIVQQIGLSGFAADGLKMLIQQNNGTLIADYLNNYAMLLTTAVTGTSAALANNSRIIADNAALVTLTLPASATSEVNISEIEVIGRGAGGWRIAQNASQTIIFAAATSTAGVTGYLESAHRRDCVKLKYVATNTWQVISHVGTPVTA